MTAELSPSFWTASISKREIPKRPSWLRKALRRWIRRQFLLRIRLERPKPTPRRSECTWKTSDLLDRENVPHAPYARQVVLTQPSNRPVAAGGAPRLGGTGPHDDRLRLPG